MTGLLTARNGRYREREEGVDPCPDDQAGRSPKTHQCTSIRGLIVSIRWYLGHLIG